MPAFCEDDDQIAKYPKGITDESRVPNEPFIKCLQWDASEQPDSENNERRDLSDAQSLIDIAEGRQSALRVVFLPNRPATNSEAKCFDKLINYYSIPSAVLAERMRRVSYPFGNSTLAHRNAEVSWCHFLCRNVNVESGVIQEDLGYLAGDLPTPGLALSPLWCICDFHLHVRLQSTEGSKYEKAVTLLCFGAPAEVVNRFGRLLRQRDGWREILLEPYLLFDDNVWRLSEAVRPEERAALRGERARTSKVDYYHMHNIQKYARLLEMMMGEKRC